MEKKFSILIYEKEEILNSILKEQLSQRDDYETFIINDQIKLLEIVNQIKICSCLINLENLNCDVSYFIDVFESKNKHKNIIGYYSKEDKTFLNRENEILLLKKPFKFITLLKYLDSLKNNKTNKYLMHNIEFISLKKIIINLDTNNKEHLTEKENNLLNYFNNNRNVNIPKIELLAKIWGVKEDINTHTLETHIYRLRQKLYKLEPNLSFSFINQNGFYSMRDNL